MKTCLVVIVVIVSLLLCSTLANPLDFPSTIELKPTIGTATTGGVQSTTNATFVEKIVRADIPPQPTPPTEAPTHSTTSGTTSTTPQTPNTTISTTTTTTTTQKPPTMSTTIKPTTIPPKPNTTSTTIAPSTQPTVAPSQDRKFDGLSFVGGIILAGGLSAIGYIGFKFYKARTEHNYHTL